jgi:hypothetical protein
MNGNKLLSLVGSSFITHALTQNVYSDTLLNRYPIIMSHDAATGDMVRDHVVADWAQTQSVGLGQQLECGSRSFDYRPYCHNGAVYAHHGGVKIDKSMEDAVTEVIDWCAHNTDELVILYVNAWDGDDGCYDLSLDVLKSLGVTPVTDCTELDTMTVSEAMNRGALANRGSMLAVYDCMFEAYDPSINCYGTGFVCYDDPSSTIPWTHMKSYMQSATRAVPVSNGYLWMAQVI